MRLGDRVERLQDPEAAFVEVLFNAAGTRPLPKVCLASVFASEEAGCKAVVDDHAEPFSDAQIPQRPFELLSLAEVVFGLLDFVARQLVCRGCIQRLSQPRRSGIRTPDRLYLSRPDERFVGAQRLLDRRVGIGAV